MFWFTIFFYFLLLRCSRSSSNQRVSDTDHILLTYCDEYKLISSLCYEFVYCCNKTGNKIIKFRVLPGSGRIDTAVWMHYLDANKTAGEEARRQLHKNVASNIEQVLAVTSHKAPTIRPPTSHHENYPS